MDIKNKPVVITDVTMKPIGTSIVYMLETSGGKFSFFNKKQDGTETKAYLPSAPHAAGHHHWPLSAE